MGLIRDRLLNPAQFVDDLFRAFMTPPAVITRIAPPGRRLKDGHGPTKATLAISADTNLNIWEIEVGLPGYDNGEAIDTTTQWNTDWRTFAARYLNTMTEFQVVGAFDPSIYDEVLALKGVETTFTIHIPDDSTLSFFGYVRTMEFEKMVEGTMPKVTLGIKPTNTDPATGAEEDPVLVSSSGT